MVAIFEYKEALSFWADFSTIVVSVVGLIAIFFRRRELFRSSLTQAQVENLSKVIDALQGVCVDLQSLSEVVAGKELMGWSVLEFKELCPEEWYLCLDYQTKSLALFQKISSERNYVFPEWVDRTVLAEAVCVMKEFSPFTIYSIQRKTQEEINAYTDALLKLASDFESALLKHA